MLDMLEVSFIVTPASNGVFELPLSLAYHIVCSTCSGCLYSYSAELYT
jgi:hypothetical protein